MACCEAKTDFHFGVLIGYCVAMNIVITGASRGIGLEFTRQLVSKGNHLLVTARAPEEAPELLRLLKGFANNLEILPLDVREEGAPERLAQAAQRFSKIDLLINNAGIYPQGEARDDFVEGFLVNSIAPYLITRALLPALKKSANPKAVFITSLMGSIEDNTSGGSCAYRSSKAALNMIVRCLSMDEPWLTTALLHPGWVQTRMGGPEALIRAEVSVRGMLRVVNQLEKGSLGAFVDYEGEKLPW